MAGNPDFHGGIQLTTLVCAMVLPFLGTALGAGGVFFLRNGNKDSLRGGLAGFSAGVMTAASVWSLIIPALEQSAGLGRLAFIPVTVGIWLGFFGLAQLDSLVSRVRGLPRGSGLLVAAVALHNLPEGMAVGAAAALWLRGGMVSGAEVTALALGIALQNIPEGAIISMPLAAAGMKRGRSFGCGVLSGAVEPVGTALTIVLAGLFLPILPMLLSLSAGAMLLVCGKELIPEAAEEGTGAWGMALFAVGFGVMMALDVALG